jgi:hypothetical protein
MARHLQATQGQRSGERRGRLFGYGRWVAFQHVILALLEDGPRHGWQMKAEIEGALGPEQGGLSKGYI